MVYHAIANDIAGTEKRSISPNKKQNTITVHWNEEIKPTNERSNKKGNIQLNYILIKAYDYVRVLLLNRLWFWYDSCTRFLLLCIMFRSRCVAHFVSFENYIDCEAISILLITALRCTTRSICSSIFLLLFFALCFYVQFQCLYIYYHIFHRFFSQT